uniref:Thioredoxin domain-containing protein 12 n=1 Tax=Lygus hesperus TaxID=30085 RepID=A0A0A9X2N1_LYGHE
MLLEVLQFVVGAARGAVFTHASAEAPGKTLDWGTKILWHTTLKEAEEVSHKTNKPVMVIIYHEYCPSCKMIIPRLTQDEQIVELSRNFTVVALHDTKALDTMKIDGGYIPRIYFMSPHGEVYISTIT